jgi:hypothetical protein
MSITFKNIAGICPLILASAVSVFGQLGPEIQINRPVLANPITMHAADLNGDKFDDVVASGWNSATGTSELVWWTNNGNGLIHQMDTIDLSYDYQIDVIWSGDLDGDDDQDLICGYSDAALSCGWNLEGPIEFLYPPPPPPPSRNGYVGWFENDGTGQFGPMIMIDDSIANPESLFVADLDGDQDLDILYGGGDGNCHYAPIGVAAWYENDGAVFQAQQLIAPLTDSLTVLSV